MRTRRAAAVVALIAGLVGAAAVPGAAAAAPGAVTPKIIGGSPVDAATAPWTVALLTAGGSQFCGGSLVTADWVVTAAHCVTGRSVSNTRVAIGVNRLSNIAASDRRALSSIIVHPSFNPSVLTSDIALLRLATPAAGAPTVAVNRSGTAPAAHQALHTYGWGQTATIVQPDQLQGVALEEMAGNSGACGDYGAYYRAAHHLCAGVPGGGKDACFGDSGGPLVAHAPSGPVLVGVTSWGVGCVDADFPGIWSRVSSYTAFLDEYIDAGASDFAVTSTLSLTTIKPGTSTSATISTTATDPVQVVNLSATGLPAGATATFAPQTITTGSSATFDLTTTSATPQGTYDVTVVATGDVTRTTTLTVVVANAVTLANATAVTASGGRQSQRFWMLQVPAGQKSLTFKVSGGSGDVDLYVRRGNAPTLTDFECRPFKGGNSESCVFNAPKPGTWYVMLQGFGSYSGARLTGRYDNAAALHNNTGVKLPAGAAGSQRLWKLVVPSGQTRVSFTLAGGSGNADLYVRFRSAPTTSTFGCRSTNGGTTERCTFAPPSSGTYYVMVRGRTAYTGVTLRGTYTH